MRKGKTCYCEVEFLTEFISSHPTMLEPNDNIIRLMGNWISMYHFICKSDVVMDVTAAEFSNMKEGNEWMSMFWKKSTNGECKIEFAGKNDFPYIADLSFEECDSRKLNSVYLTTLPDKRCIELSKELGILILNNNLVKICDHLYIDNGTEFPSEKAKDWDFMRSLNRIYPFINICNSMIIVDNYLFSDDIKNGFDERLEYNLQPILKSLLPETLAKGEVFEIAVFTGEDGMNYERQVNYLRSLLAKLRPRLSFKVCFYGKSKSAFHDRAILTNNVWISSGHGFDIFGKTKDIGKPTTINIAFPFLQSKLLWCDGSYLNVIAQAVSVSNRLAEPNINYWGDEDRSNRILQYYTKIEKNSQKSPTVDVSKMVLHANMKIDLSTIPDYSKWGRSRFTK